MQRGERALADQRVGRLVELLVASVIRLGPQHPVLADLLHLHRQLGTEFCGTEARPRKPRQRRQRSPRVDQPQRSTVARHVPPRTISPLGPSIRAFASITV